jgi:hypothetical protein
MGAVESGGASADFDDDGDADGTDFLVWQQNVSRLAPAGMREKGDADLDGDVDSEDLEHWKGQITGVTTALRVTMVSSTEKTETEAIRLAAAVDAVYAAGDFTVLFDLPFESDFINSRMSRRLRPK